MTRDQPDTETWVPIKPAVMQFGDVVIDRNRRVLLRSGMRQNLGDSYFEALLLLIDRRPRVASKTELNEILKIADDSVPKAVESIRKALGEVRGTKDFIVTERKLGYRFVAEETPKAADAYSPVSPKNGTARHFASNGGYILLSCLLLLAILGALGLPFRTAEAKLTHGMEITASHRAKLSPLLSDGAYIYFEEFENDRYAIARVPGGGGESTSVNSSLSNPELCDITPDGSSLLVRNLTRSRDDLEPLYLMSIDGSARRIGEFLAYDAAWYPDGRHIVFTAKGTFYLTDLTGSDVRKLFSTPGNGYWMRWSPDRKRMRFTVLDPKTEATSIWEASTDKWLPRRLLADWKQDIPPCCGSWTPNGHEFVFQVRQNNRYDIWAWPEKHGLFGRGPEAPTRLTTAPINFRGPLPSKDGRKLFARTEVLKGELVRFDKERGVFTPFFTQVSAETVDISKNGERIAYTDLRDKNLWECRIDGSACLQLTTGFQHAALPRWSADGQHIAFMGRHFDEKWGVYITKASGGTPLRLSAGLRGEGDPDYSPDGQKLVFCNMLEPTTDMALFVTDLQTGQSTQIPESTGLFSPRWSPDGNRLAAVRSGDHHLVMYQFDLHKWRPVTNLPVDYPNWTHDGKYVYFSSSDGRARIIYRLIVATGELEKFADLRDIQQGPFLFGDWFGLTDNDHPMVMRNLTTEDIYGWDFKP